MITIDYDDSLVSVTILGEFTLADFKEFEDLVNDHIRFPKPVELLFDLREMIGFTLDVAWEEIKFSREHLHDFQRIAIITDSQWVTWSAWLGQLFVSAQIQVFDDFDPAKRWAQTGEEPPLLTN